MGERIAGTNPTLSANTHLQRRGAMPLFSGTPVSVKTLQGPVREALRDLAMFGFVVCSPFRNTCVRQSRRKDLVKSYPVRAALESVAAREAASIIDDETLAQLEDLIALMRSAAEANHHRAHVDADVGFHHTIIKAAEKRLARACVAVDGAGDDHARDALDDP
jgi:DNA-binding GntR family transcriptional regulator